MTKTAKDLGLTEAELAAQVAITEAIVDELIAEERAAKRFEQVTYTAPAHWASYLFNGDASGLDYYNTPGDDAGDREIAAADAFIESVGLGSPTGCSEESEFRWNPDYSAREADGRKLGADCLTYTFLREVKL